MFCICIREHLNPYSYSSKNVVKGVIRIRFHNSDLFPSLVITEGGIAHLV
jgi:hypothetical protein